MRCATFCETGRQLGSLESVMVAVAVRANMNETPRVTPSASDHARIQRAVSGDNQAFREIFDAHVSRVKRFLRDILKSAEAADEATQETFVRAHGRLHSLDDPNKLSSWLLGIARFVALEHLRAVKKERMHDSMDSEGAGHEQQLPTELPSPATLLLKAEADQMLADALSHLSSERQQALLLRIDHRLDYQQIADIMEWPLSKVKNEIHRARLELRKQLSDYGPGGQR